VGGLVGCRLIGLRLPGWNRDGRYCDTPCAATSSCLLEDPPGSNEMLRLENPVKLEVLTTIFRRWYLEAPGAHHSFSITGGEPLLHVDLLCDWLPELRQLLPIYLETNGTLPDALERLLPDLNWVAMDIKLESQTGLPTEWELHHRFLQLANRTDCFVKIVVGEETPALELQLAAELVTSVSSDIPLILQPVTVDDRVDVSTRRLLEMQRLISGTHSNVRIIPQTHIFLGVL
jgi:organic radical activating enzyme